MDEDLPSFGWTEEHIIRLGETGATERQLDLIGRLRAEAAFDWGEQWHDIEAEIARRRADGELTPEQLRDLRGQQEAIKDRYRATCGQILGYECHLHAALGGDEDHEDFPEPRPAQAGFPGHRYPSLTFGPGGKS